MRSPSPQMEPLFWGPVILTHCNLKAKDLEQKLSDYLLGLLVVINSDSSQSDIQNNIRPPANDRSVVFPRLAP
jgi:hypothetical protein